MVSRSRAAVLKALGLVAVLSLVLTLVAPVPAGGQDTAWRSPVEAVVTDGFRPPSQRWASGNRGLAFATQQGQQVVAVADGTVTFAGPVGRTLHVTVEHGDGLRSTYAYLASVSVVRGQVVRQGQTLATATPGFHLTARLGDAYVDPAALLVGGGIEPRLVPTATGGTATGGTGPSSGGFSLGRGLRRLGSGVAGLAGQGVEAVSQAVGSAERVATAAVDRLWDVASDATLTASLAAADAVAAGLWSPAAIGLSVLESFLPPVFDPARALGRLIYDLLPVAQAVALARAVTSWHRSGDRCTEDDVPVPPGGDGRVLIQVGGLGTSSNGASIAKFDPATAGYDDRDVIGFSYAGGCTPTPFGFDAAPAGSLAGELDTTTYSRTHTYQDLDVSAARLADLIEDVRAARPDAPIDLAAHSLGGVVARRAIDILAERRGEDAVPVSVVVTMGSPHQGAELATASIAIHGDPLLPTLLGLASPDRLLEARATSVAQLARGTSTELPPPQEPPADVRVVSVAAPGDLVVPAERSRWPGAVNTIAGPTSDIGLDAHGQLPARPEVQRELALAIAGLPARCIAFASAVGAALTSRGIAAVEAGATVTAIVMGP